MHRRLLRCIKVDGVIRVNPVNADEYVGVLGRLGSGSRFMVVNNIRETKGKREQDEI
jgi:hypothetical protein